MHQKTNRPPPRKNHFWSLLGVLFSEHTTIDSGRNGLFVTSQVKLTGRSQVLLFPFRALITGQLIFTGQLISLRWQGYSFKAPPWVRGQFSLLRQTSQSHSTKAVYHIKTVGAYPLPQYMYLGFFLKKCPFCRATYGELKAEPPISKLLQKIRCIWRRWKRNLGASRICTIFLQTPPFHISDFILFSFVAKDKVFSLLFMSLRVKVIL